MKILRRYVLSRFAASFGFSAAGFVVIFVVVDLANRIAAYLDQGTSAREILLYYLWSIPYFLFLVLPMAMLLGSLFCIGGLTRRNELSAMKTAGVSLYRILTPIQLFALFISLGAWGASWEIIPRANRERASRSLETGSSIPVRQHRVQLVLRDVDDQVVSLGEYRTDEEKGRRVTIDRYTEGRLAEKIRADEFIWDGDGWLFVGGERRLFLGDGERVVPFDTTRANRVTLVPADFSREAMPVEQRDTDDLRALIERKQMNGQEASRDRVELALRMAFSFSGLVMVLFGLPLSSHTRRASRPLQIGICLLVSFVFYGTLQATRAMGWNGLLDPVSAAWGPNVLFLLVGGEMLRRAHT